MTKQDYELIAKAIKQTIQTVAATAVPATAPLQLRAVAFTAISIATNLATKNARFDTNRFLEACGIDPEFNERL